MSCGTCVQVYGEEDRRSPRESSCKVLGARSDGQPLSSQRISKYMAAISGTPSSGAGVAGIKQNMLSYILCRLCRFLTHICLGVRGSSLFKLNCNCVRPRRIRCLVSCLSFFLGFAIALPEGDARRLFAYQDCQ